MRLILHLRPLGVLTWLCLGLVCGSLSAQRETLDSLVFKRHWEIGADLLPLFNKNRLPEATIFARYRFSERYALRLRGGLDYYRGLATEFYIEGELGQDILRTVGPYTSAGIEWRKSHGRTATLAILESDFSYNNSRESGYNSIADTLYRVITARTIQTGITGILGVQYRLNERLSLSLESSLRWAWMSDKLSLDSTQYGNNVGSNTIQINRKGLVLQPVHILQLTCSLRRVPLSKNRHLTPFRERNYWEAGVDFLPLVRPYNLPRAYFSGPKVYHWGANTLLARYNYINAKGKPRALRLRAGVSYVDSSFHNRKLFAADSLTGINASLSVGHEWQHRSRQDKHRWYWGIEAEGSAERTYWRYGLRPLNPAKHYHRWDRRVYNIGLNGLLGYQYQITTHLALGAESYVLYRYQHHWNKTGIGEIDQPPSGKGLQQIYSHFVVFRPLHAIHLIFSLNKS